MSQKPTAGYHTRLRRALEEGPRAMSVRGLHAAMKERYPHLRGSSYGGVREYAAGNVSTPRAELLRAFADVLGVRGDWLAFGRGAMTEIEESARRRVDSVTAAGVASSDVSADRHWALQLKWEVLEGLGFQRPRRPVIPPFGVEAECTPEEQDQLFDAIATDYNYAHIPHWVPTLQDVQHRTPGYLGGEQIGAALRGPLTSLGIDVRAGIDTTLRVEDWLSDYVVAMAPVLLGLVTAPRLPEAADPQTPEQGGNQ